MLWASAGGEGMDAVPCCCSVMFIPLILWLSIRSIWRDSAIEAMIAIYFILFPYILVRAAIAGQPPTEDRYVLEAREWQSPTSLILEVQLAIAVLALLWVGLRFTVRRYRARHAQRFS